MENNDPTKVETTITLAGVEYTLVYPIPSLFAFEDATGLELFNGEVKGEDLLGRNFRERCEKVTWMLWAGMLVKHPDMAKNTSPEVRAATHAKVANLLYLGNVNYVVKIVEVAFMASVASAAEESPTGEGGESEPPLPEASPKPN